MRFRLAAVALAVLLPLAACGGRGESVNAAPPAASSAAETEPPAPEPVEGSATEAHAWPDGVTARVVSVTATPAVEPENPVDDTEVKVTVEFGNQGAAPVEFGAEPNTIDAGPHVGLLYGVNRTQAQSWFYGDNQLPTRLTPDTAAMWTATFTAPGAELGELAVSVTPTQEHPAWTFTGVEKILG